MTTHNLSAQEHSLGIQIGNVSRILDELDRKLGDLNAELESHSSQRHQYKLLHTIVASLDELEQLGASDLFWDRQSTGYAPEPQVQRVRQSIAAFEHKISLIENRRNEVLGQIEVETHNLRRLNHELADLEEEAEALRHELPVLRDASEIPYRPLVMPWSRHEDDKRYRKIAFIALLFSTVMSTGILYFKPTHEKKEEEILPEHIAELVVKKKEEPKPPKKQERLEQDSNREANPNARHVQSDAPPAPPGTPESKNAARASAQTKGVLAHANDFAGLMDSPGPAKVGAEGRVSNTGQIAAGDAATRSLIVSTASGGSGGISSAAFSRNGSGGGAGGSGTGTGGGGSSITGSGIKVARVESATGKGVASDRPTAGKGGGVGRTDEEIQIVFDRYKAALYRIYNRELRNNPGLAGKMVLRVTIEPDGRVSACSVKSTDLNSPALSAEIVDRVLKFNFGPKEGVPAVTITYPIDFLPAS